jgi:basic amino acid/polyamine antiporter, APA family
MVATLLVSMVVYAAVAAVAVGAAGAVTLAEATNSAAAPLETVARQLGIRPIAAIVAAGAIVAMVGVLLNLLLGLSRVLLAMSRRGDMPGSLAQVEAASGSPRRAVLVMGVVVAALVFTGSVRLTWSLSAFTVLVYYAITNLAALRVAAADRIYPRIIPAAGLISCLGLAFWVDRVVWLTGLAVIAAGLVWHLVARAVREPARPG